MEYGYRYAVSGHFDGMALPMRQKVNICLGDTDKWGFVIPFQTPEKARDHYAARVKAQMENYATGRDDDSIRPLPVWQTLLEITETAGRK